MIVASTIEPCPHCDADFDHTPELCTLRQIADHLENINNALWDIASELETTRRGNPY